MQLAGVVPVYAGAVLVLGQLCTSAGRMPVECRYSVGMVL